MHELSIATALVAQASDAAAVAGAERVSAVTIALGELSGVVPGALEFAFELAAQGTALDGARLVVERVPVTVWCSPCASEVALASSTRFRCPACDTPSADIRAGRELHLRSLEVPDPAPAPHPAPDCAPVPV